MTTTQEDAQSPRQVLTTLLRRIIGAPDYAAYRRHIAACHPGTEPLSEPEFLDERLQARYSQPGNRCC
jgi:uncharacterized short protein YbdD (DUF466 family)